MIDKASTLDPDGIIFDLEDAVPPGMKDSAREMVAEAIRRDSAAGSAARFVRVNGTQTGRLETDIRAVVHPNLVGVVLPKVENTGEIARVDELLQAEEEANGIRVGSIRLLITIESARGLRHVFDLVDASPRNVAVFMGGEDFALDLGLPVVRAGAGQEQIYARSMVVVAAASARIYSVDQGSLEFRDLEAFRRHTTDSRELGFTTGWCIHPNQIPVANAVFSPTTDEVDLARKIVAAFEEAQAAGIGAVMMGGQFIELPIVARAQRTLHLHNAIVGARSTEVPTALPPTKAVQPPTSV